MVYLELPFHVPAGLCKYENLLFLLRSSAESQARLAEAAVGGPLASHFLEFGSKPFKCFRLLDDAVLPQRGDPEKTFYIRSPMNYAHAAGVVAETVERLPDLEVREEEDHDERCSDDEDGGNDAAPMPGQVSAGTDEAVADRLKSLYKTVKGAVPHKYTTVGLLAFLELCSNLKPGADVANVLASSATIFFGAPGQSLSNRLRAREFALPTAATLRTARLGMDLVSLRFQQRHFLRYATLIYPLIDASPQLGYNFLGMIEDVIRIPEPQTISLAQRVALDLNESWDSVVQAFSSLGMGKAGTLKKTMNTSHLLLMGVSTVAEFDIKRCFYKGLTTDMGVEAGVTDHSVGVVPSMRGRFPARDRMSYLYPDMIGIIDALHVLWGGYETACKANSLFRNWEDTLSMLVAFTSDRQAMNKMRAICCRNDPEARKALKTKAVVHIDWRWESMDAALDIQVPIHLHLRKNFNLGELLSTDAAGKLLQTAIVKNC